MSAREGKHTPGPWTAEPRANPNFGCEVYAQDPSEYAADGELVRIAADIIPRDARLIAAAPDLLAALKLAEFGFNHSRCVVCAGWNVGPNGETDRVHTKECPVGLAIAKAEGSEAPR